MELTQDHLAREHRFGSQVLRLQMLTFNHYTQSLKLLLPLLCWISWSPLELGLWFGSEMLLWVTHEGTRDMQPPTRPNIRLFYEVTYFLFLEGCLSLYRVMESESTPTRTGMCKEQLCSSFLHSTEKVSVRRNLIKTFSENQTALEVRWGYGWVVTLTWNEESLDLMSLRICLRRTRTPLINYTDVKCR